MTQDEIDHLLGDIPDRSTILIGRIREVSLNTQTSVVTFKLFTKSGHFFQIAMRDARGFYHWHAQAPSATYLVFCDKNAHSATASNRRLALAIEHITDDYAEELLSKGVTK